MKKQPKRYVVSLQPKVHEKLKATAKTERRKMQDVAEMLLLEALSVRNGKA